MFEKLVNIICNYVEVEPENIHPESRFMEDLGFSSSISPSILIKSKDVKPRSSIKRDSGWRFSGSTAT